MNTKELALWIGGLFLGVVVVVLAFVLGTWVYQQFQGDILSRDFQNVKHSQAYVESTNTQLRMLVTEYNKADAERATYTTKGDKTTAAAYEGQMVATMNQMKALAGTLSPNEVAPDVQTFLATHK